MENEELDYRLFLKHELEIRRRKNPAYSLRSLSRKLDVSAAYLSQIFSGKRVLSESTGFAFAQKLNWPAKRRKLFQNLILYRRAKKIEVKKAILANIRDLSELKFLELAHDEFRLISEWFHFAILELSIVRGFRWDPAWIARRLSISKDQVNSAIERLKRVGLLVEKNGKLVRQNSTYRIRDIQSEAIRLFHAQNLKKAQLALNQQEFADRDFSGTTLAINRDSLPELKSMIRDFRNQLNHFCEQNRTPDSVYQLSIQLFRLDLEL